MMQDANQIRTLHSTRLMQLGVLLFLLGLFNGFLIHSQSLPHVVLAAHLLAIMGGTFMIAIGLMWPKLKFSQRISRVNFFIAIYSFYGGWLLYLLAGIAGLGGMFPLAAGAARGPDSLELVISSIVGTVALAMIWLCGSLIWGLRASHSHE